MMTAKPSIRRPAHPAPLARHAQAGWTESHDESLRQGMAALGLAPAQAQARALGVYASLLLKWNRTYNLLGTDDPDTVLEGHLLDGLAVLPALQRWLPAGDAPLVDVGSGGGLPGIPIAIMRPELPLVLVEPTGKKAAFLRQAVAECNLASVSVREARLETLSSDELVGARPSEQLACAHFICRAFTSLAAFAKLCAARSTPESLIMAMKAARVEDEMMELRATVPQINVLAVEPLSVPGQRVQRSLVVMQPRQRAASEPVTTTSGA